MKQAFIQILRRIQLSIVNRVSNKKLIGVDGVGNRYFEEQRDSFPRRTVELNDGSKHYDAISSSDLPVQWRAWLRHTRTYPPSLEEIEYHERLRISTVQKAKLLDEAWQKTKLLRTDNEQVKEAKKIEEPPSKPLPAGKQNEEFQPESWSPTLNR